MRSSAVLVMAVLFALSGCNLMGHEVYRVDAIWLPSNHIYVVHDRETGKEIWRRENGKEIFVAKAADIPGACGPVDFLFRASEGRLGIALECPGLERLVAYSPSSGNYEPLRDIVPRAGELSVRPDGQGGYLSTTASRACWYIATFGNTPADALAALKRFSCEEGGTAKSPRLLPDGDLAFVASATGRSLDLEQRTWHLYKLTPGALAARRVGGDLVGFPEMDVSPDGRTAVIALSRKGIGSLIAIDLETGRHRQIAKATDPFTSPTISPDGHRVMYIEDFREPAIAELRN